jgi:hypothetical protein
MHDCPKRKNCVRYNTFPNPYRQSYFKVEEGKEEEFIKNCQHFWKDKKDG